jgi:hypothetical protein
MSSLRRRLLLFAAVKLTAVKFWQAGGKTRVYFNFNNRNYTGYIEPANTGEAGGWTMRYPAINQGGEVTRDAMQQWLTEKFGHSHKPKFIDIWLKAGGPPLGRSEPVEPKRVPAPIKTNLEKYLHDWGRDPTGGQKSTAPIKSAPTVPDRKLKDEQYRAELAGILTTTVKNLPNRMAGMKLGITCPRCGGSGHYSFNQISGTTCFQCHGAGIIIPKKSLQWEAVITEAKKEVKAGKLTEYMEYLAARKLTKTAMEQLFAAWRATEVAKDYEAHWQTSKRTGYDPAASKAFLQTPLYLANKRMANVSDQMQKLSGPAQYEKDLTKRRTAVLQLKHALDAGLQEIAEAQKWYSKNKGK